MNQPFTEHQMEKQQVKMAIAYVFREEPTTLVAVRHDVSPQTVRRRLRSFGIHIRSTSEQRHCDRRHGRFFQSAALKAAWVRGAFDTENYRQSLSTRSQYDRHGNLNPFFGKAHSSETKDILRAKAINRTISGIGEYGDDWTDELRAKILERDNCQCQICGVTDGKLQVHHIDLDRTNNTSTNLLTLCASCHLAYHGRQELVAEIALAHSKLFERMGVSIVGATQ